MAAAPLLTTEDYFATPETLRPAQLVYGVLHVAESPTVKHQQAVGEFHLHLVRHVRAHTLGTVLLSPIDVVLDYRRAVVLQPDLLFVSKARFAIVQRKITAAPDMILEVLSPNPRVGELSERLELFAHYGVREMWLLHQAQRRFEVLSATDGKPVHRYTINYSTGISSEVLPDFRMSVDDILQDADF